LSEPLTVGLAAELLSGIDGSYNDIYDVFVDAVGHDNVIDIRLSDSTDPEAPKRMFRFTGEELNG